MYMSKGLFKHYQLPTRMKTAKLFFLIVNFFLVCGKTFSQDTINWRPDYKLQWKDFQETPDTTSEHGAVSTIQTKYTFTSTEKDFSFKIYCFFEKKKSWVRVLSNEGLIHEQGHFNISEIYARKLMAAFKNYKFNPATVVQDLKNIFAQIKMERGKMDDLYDKETDFHRNSINQEKWNKKIKQELSRLPEIPN